RTLFHSKPVASYYTLRKLSPLLAGTSMAVCREQPVSFLHQSLRDFLIVEQEWNEELTLLCLDILNHELDEKTADVGYLAMDSKELPGIRIVGQDEIPEALWYACQYWIDHLLDVRMPVPIHIEKTLQLFLDRTLVQWMEVMAARGVYRGLAEVQNWTRKLNNGVQSTQRHSYCFVIVYRMKTVGQKG
ncbi:hypothetical protein FRC07_006224, partial [Ceratobasidium sp. 392]